MEKTVKNLYNTMSKKIDFIKMKYEGETYNLKGMLDKGWITKEWVSSIIQDLKQKLESRGFYLLKRIKF